MTLFGGRVRHSVMRAASRLPWSVLNRAARRWPGDPTLFDGFWLDAHYYRWARKKIEVADA